MNSVLNWSAAALGCFDSVFFDGNAARSALNQLMAKRSNTWSDRWLTAFERATKVANFFELALPAIGIGGILRATKVATRKDQTLQLISIYQLTQSERANVFSAFGDAWTKRAVIAKPYELTSAITGALRKVGLAVQITEHRKPIELMLKQTANNIEAARPQYEKLIKSAENASCEARD